MRDRRRVAAAQGRAYCASAWEDSDRRRRSISPRRASAPGARRLDTVDFSNLQRQILYSSRDVGAASSRRGRRLTFRSVRACAWSTRLLTSRCIDIICSKRRRRRRDNFPTRYLVNDACCSASRMPTAASFADGQASVFATKDGPCYRCCIGAAATDRAELRGRRRVKRAPGIGARFRRPRRSRSRAPGRALAGRLLLLDALVGVPRSSSARSGVPIGDRQTITALIDYDQFCASPVAQAATRRISARR